MIKHSCRRCGNCCIIHWGSFGATHEDVARWTNECRIDILQQIVPNLDNRSAEPYLFISKSCPFLRRDERQNLHYCAINETKPDHCRNYPDDGICEYVADP